MDENARLGPQTLLGKSAVGGGKITKTSEDAGFMVGAIPSREAGGIVRKGTLVLQYLVRSPGLFDLLHVLSRYGIILERSWENESVRSR